jgi:kynurenine formamidase
VVDHAAFLEHAAELSPGDMVIVQTGIWKHFQQEFFTTDMPVLDERSISYLVNLPIKAYATDCISVDRLDSPLQTNHHLLLGNDIPIIEGLTNLDQISSSPVFLVVLPLKVADREAAPARAIAIEDLEDR